LAKIAAKSEDFLLQGIETPDFSAIFCSTRINKAASWRRLADDPDVARGNDRSPMDGEGRAS
jgi:hypothetical protein